MGRLNLSKEVLENAIGVHRNLEKIEPLNPMDEVAVQAMEELLKYRDAEEQGLLLRLPCKVGDTIYKIPSETNYRLNIANGYTENNRVYKQPVYSVQMWSNGRFVVNTCEGLDSVLSDSFGKTWFLTEEEAEQALKQMGE